IEAVTHVRELIPDFEHISGNGDGQGACLASDQVIEIEGAELLVDDRPRSGRGRLKVQSVVLERPAHFPCLDVIGEEGYRALPVGEKIDLLPDPHGLIIVGIRAGDFLDPRIGEVGDPDWSGCASPVAFPGSESPPQRDVGDVHPRTMSGAGGQVSRRGSPPSAGMTKTSTLPSYSPVKAIREPSGEKTGLVSTPGPEVILWDAPPSRGTFQRSPA